MDYSFVLVPSVQCISHMLVSLPGDVILRGCGYFGNPQKCFLRKAQNQQSVKISYREMNLLYGIAIVAAMR